MDQSVTFHDPAASRAHAATSDASTGTGDAAAGPGDHAAFRLVRARSEALAAALTTEDRCIQSMPDASPANWHLAHTTWFFEQFVLAELDPGYRPLDPDFHFLFNSYYESLGERQPRPFRGLVTRPDGAEITAYRRHVDAAMAPVLDAGAVPAPLLQLGLAHEEQHQELLLTDAIHALSHNPLAWGRRPIAVLPGWVEPHAAPTGAPLELAGGIVTVGVAGDGFRFDNEGPRHEVRLHPCALAPGLVTNDEWLAFMRDGGYRRPEFWMSDGWSDATGGGWTSPLYWREAKAGGFEQFGPGGVAPLDGQAAVRHISWYEADAYARWAGARLPTEHELEAAHGMLADAEGQVWQWTGSAYLPYPGFRPPAGAVGEYNGKFMINQMVLRGSSWATAPGHGRASYRNFFHPDKRWQVTGLRLAFDR